MKFLRSILILSMLAGMAGAFAQAQPAGSNAQSQADIEAARRREEAIRAAEASGIPVEIGAIAGIRGARSNTIMGYGLVVGLAGTGDSKQIVATSTALANALTRWGTLVDPSKFASKNIAIVSVTAELPPFAAPGRKIDVTVQSLGDAKSLEGGVLLPTSLGSMADSSISFAMASGALSIGGFNAGSSGNTVRKNHPTVARIPDGADIQRGVDTKFVFQDNIVFLDLDQPDFTTVKRVRDQIAGSFPSLNVTAIDAVTVAIRLPNADDAVDAISQILKMEVYANSEPLVVINERTGTIVVGGNVRLGPALIAHGSLRVTIQTEFIASQPLPFSQGQTVITPQTQTNAEEQIPQVVVVAPNASLDDLAKIFQAMDISARDIIAILQALADQGALKARIRIE